MFEIMAKYPSKGTDRIYYDVGDRRFIDVTQRCNLDCVFCPRQGEPDSGLDNYQLRHEPSLTRLIDAVCATGNCREVIFSGLGEPTYRLYDVLKAARYLKKRGVKVTLHTNGLADRIHERMIAPDLEDNIDEINVSLNAFDADSFDSICRPNIDGAFKSVIDFIESAKEYVPSVNIVSIGDVEVVQHHRIRDLAASLGVGYRELSGSQHC